MNSKFKTTINLTLILILLFIITLFVSVKCEAKASTPKYTASYSYVLTLVSVDGSGNETESVEKSESGVSTSNLKYTSSLSGEFKVSFFGDGFTSSTLAQAATTYITDKTLSLSLTSPYPTNLTKLYNPSGSLISSASGKEVSFNDLSSGEYTVNITGTGNNFTTGGGHAYYRADITIKIKVDGEAPEVTFDRRFSNTSFTVTASDDFSGGYRIFLKRPSASNYSGYSSPYTVPEGSAEGIYYVYANDKAGNKSEPITCGIDRTPPVIKVLSVTDEDITSSAALLEVPFKINASDGISGINDLIIININTGETVIDPNLPVEDDGEYLVRATDNAGNETEIYVTLDRFGPKAYGTAEGADVNGKSVNKNVTFSVSEDLEIVNVILKKDGEIVPAYNGITVTENGSYEFSATDRFGKVSNTVHVVIDKIRPVISLSAGGSALSSESWTNVNPSVSSNESNIIIYVKGEGEKTEYSGGFLAEGYYLFTAEDEAGNISDAVGIYLDRTPPTGAVYKAGAEVSGTVKGSIYYHATDNYSGTEKVYVSVNGGLYTEISDGEEISASGNYSFYSVDRSGNNSERCVIILDNDAPVIHSDKGNNPGGTFTVSGTDASPFSIYCKKPGDPDYTKGNESTEISGNGLDGEYLFYAEDDLGNVSSVLIVSLSVEVPDYNIVFNAGHTKASVEFSSGSCTIDGIAYTGGTEISVCGMHSGEITGEYGRKAVFSFEILHNLSSEYFPSTCLSSGYTRHTCSKCNYSYDDGLTGLSGHTYSDWEITIQPTCTEDGLQRRTCSVCGFSETTAALKTGHNYINEIIPSTCTEHGYTAHTCDKCGDYFESDTLPLVSHTYSSWAVTVEPGCVSSGLKERFCTVCNHTDSEALPVLGHNFAEETVEALCSDMGYVLHKCTVCGEEYKTDYTEALGHSYSITETIDMTCENNGCTRHICSLCGDYYDTDIIYSQGHVFTVLSVSEADCTEEGERISSCIYCLNEKTEVIEALGHNYILTGERGMGLEIIRTYTCQNCGDEKTETIQSDFEEIIIAADGIFSFSSPYIFIIAGSCSAVWATVLGIRIIVARKRDEKEKAGKLIYAFLIGTIGIAVLVMAVPFIVRAVAALFV